LRRRKARGNPDRIHAEVFQVIKLGSNPVEIADTVIVAVGKTTWVELIKDRVLPPGIPLRMYGLDMRGQHGCKHRDVDGEFVTLSMHVNLRL